MIITLVSKVIGPQDNCWVQTDVAAGETVAECPANCVCILGHTPMSRPMSLLTPVETLVETQEGSWCRLL